MDFQSWKTVHEQQLNEIPEIYWESLFTKLCTENFDAAEHFIMTPSSSGWRVRVSSSEGIKVNDGKSVFLIDHSWTYLPENCYHQLHSVPGLAKRMANLMDLIDRPTTPSTDTSDDDDDDGVIVAVNGGSKSVNGIDSSSEEENDDDNGQSVMSQPGHVDEPEIESEREVTIDETPPSSPPTEELVLLVMDNIWRFNDCYSIFNVPAPVWYILEEFGSRIPHSNNPSMGIKPFFHILTQMSHSIIWPLRDLNYGDDVTRNRIPSFARTGLEKACYVIPWSPPNHLSLTDDLWAECDSIPSPPMPDNYNENLPDEWPSKSPILALPYKVFTNVDLVKKSLTHPQFVLVNSSEEANILWPFDHFKDYDSLPPNCFINQFPGENVLTCKDLLATVSKNIADGNTPKWLPETYNLLYELPRFVHRYKTLKANESDNTWIIKPWNLGRGMDTHITQNLVQVIRLVNTIPKVACRYITNPVLFHRDEIGMVKMDIRYVVMLVSVKPLVLYAYNTFWLRFANRPFSLDSFHDYQKHFTVMNYQEGDVLKHIESADFIPMFDSQYPMHPWESVEKDIFKAMWELFKSASMKPYPAGIGEFPQSRAMYAIDLMLEWTEAEQGCDCRIMQPKLLEVNFCPDTIRACKYHENFYNHVFECLFLPESLHNIDLPVTKLEF